MSRRLGGGVGCPFPPAHPHVCSSPVQSQQEAASGHSFLLGIQSRSLWRAGCGAGGSGRPLTVLQNWFSAAAPRAPAVRLSGSPCRLPPSLAPASGRRFSTFQKPCPGILLGNCRGGDAALDPPSPARKTDCEGVPRRPSHPHLSPAINVFAQESWPAGRENFRCRSRAVFWGAVYGLRPANSFSTKTIIRSPPTISKN